MTDSGSEPILTACRNLAFRKPWVLLAAGASAAFLWTGIVLLAFLLVRS